MAYQTWTLEQDSILRDLVEKCLKASEIGTKLGVTRNAVIGRMYRLGIKCEWRQVQVLSLEERRRRKAEYERKYRASLGGIHARREWRKMNASRMMRNQIVCCESPKAIWDLVWCDCRWIVTPDGTPLSETYFCSNVIEPGKPYCAAHSRMAHDVRLPGQFAKRPGFVNKWTTGRGQGRAA